MDFNFYIAPHKTWCKRYGDNNDSIVFEKELKKAYMFEAKGTPYCDTRSWNYADESLTLGYDFFKLLKMGDFVYPATFGSDHHSGMYLIRAFKSMNLMFKVRAFAFDDNSLVSIYLSAFHSIVTGKQNPPS